MTAPKTVTVRVDDLIAVLQAAEYVENRSLRGPVDRMGDALCLAIHDTADPEETP